MKVDLGKNVAKDVFDTLKPQFYVLLPGKSPPKPTLGKISYVTFCKLAQITKRVDNFRRGVPTFDRKLK